LDGLRAVAVLLVIASHVFQGWYINAGPVGVMLFFALSGFLITAMLVEQHGEHGAIDLRAFFIRRARRLLPAAGVMVAAWAGSR